MVPNLTPVLPMMLPKLMVVPSAETMPWMAKATPKTSVPPRSIFSAKSLMMPPIF